MPETANRPSPPGPDETEAARGWGRGARWRARGWALLRDLALLLVVLGAVQLWRGRDLVGRGEEAPALELVDLDGQHHALADLRGKTVLVHFWATWCGVCRREFGALRAVERSIGPGQVLLTVVEDSEDVARLRSFAAEHDLSYPVLLAGPETMVAWRVGVFPTNYYIDEDGTIAMRQTGMATRWGMRIRLLLAGL